MEHHYCLNCSEETAKKFCANCGQKTDTHRITLKHFIFHDLLHGVWHIERGILFTLKEAIVRPGQAALDYIDGKRIRYYNVFYLCLLMIGLNIVLSHFYQNFEAPQVTNAHNANAFVKFLSDYSRLIIFSLVPVLAFNSWLVFRRLKLNIAEHSILAGITLLGILCICVVFLFVAFITSFEGVPAFVDIFGFMSFFSMLLFPAWSCYNAFRPHYSLMGYAWRFLIFYGLVLLQLLLMIFVLAYALTGKTDIEV